MTTQVVTIERPAATVTIAGGDEQPDTVVVQEPATAEVIIVQTGAIGERGPAGERGPPGDAGDDVPDLTLIFDNQLV